jgi:hypothetical protein
MFTGAAAIAGLAEGRGLRLCVVFLRRLSKSSGSKGSISFIPGMIFILLLPIWATFSDKSAPSEKNSHTAL